MKQFWTWASNQPVLFAGLAATLVLGAAFGFQLAGYPPCDMCWWQRYPYMAVIGLAALAVGLGWQGSMAVRLGIGLLFAGTGAIGLFHWGVENGWWEGLTSCAAGLDLGNSPEEALDAILSAPVIRCDQVPWSLFGLSMAGYNMVTGTALSLFMLQGLRRRQKRSEG